MPVILPNHTRRSRALTPAKDTSHLDDQFQGVMVRV